MSDSTPHPAAPDTGTAHPEAHVQLRLLSQPRYLCGAREMVSSIARRIGFDELAAGQIALAVDEALANVMRHGYEDRQDGPIWLSVWPIEKGSSAGSGNGAAGANGSAKAAPIGLRIVIEDEAKQVDPTCIRSRDLNDIRPGGLGVHIIKHVMDCCEYSKRQSCGMRLTLEKRLEARSS